MNITLRDSELSNVIADTLVIFAHKGKKEYETALSAAGASLDRKLGLRISKTLALEHFEADAGKSFVIHVFSDVPVKRILVVGAGSKKELSALDILKIGGAAGRRAKGSNSSSVALSVDRDIFPDLTLAAELLTEGILLSTYTFLKHKDKNEQKKNHDIDEFIFVSDQATHEDLKRGFTRGQINAQAVRFTRDLVNEPPSVSTPTFMAAVAMKLAKDNPEISCDVLERADMKTLGMGGLLAIAQGSEEPPKFVRLTYKGRGKKTVALVGKGITFDTGGLSLKPPGSMETMKLDMAGAATVLGVFSALAALKPTVTVEGILCLTENMPSGTAVKPGDVVTIMNGKTVEILNTDAEGRMVLSDGLSYAAEKIQPDIMIDLATLTGACMVALGEDIAGIFSNNHDLARTLLSDANATGERLWELPLADEYREAIKSSVADIKNISASRYGGAINGAIFLQEFVPDSIAWAHLDIAGPAFAEKDSVLTPVGGTGFGVRTLLRYLISL